MLEIFKIISDFSFTWLYVFGKCILQKKTRFSNLTFKINYYDEITKFRNMSTSLCCFVRRDMCDRYPEQISGKFPQRERKKQIPIHLMKVRALKARKGGERERQSVIKVPGDSPSKREYLSLYFLRAMYSLFHKRARISFDGHNYVCSRNEYDRLPKAGYYMHSTNHVLQEARTRCWRAFKPRISPRFALTGCIRHVSLQLVINFLDRTTTRRVDVRQKRNVIFHSTWREKMYAMLYKIFRKYRFF